MGRSRRELSPLRLWLFAFIMLTAALPLFYRRALMASSTTNGGKCFLPFCNKAVLYRPSHRNTRDTENSHATSSLPNTEKGRDCALLFFGLIKSFSNLVLPSIRENILQNNPSCDIFLHTYNFTNIPPNIRNNESKDDLEYRVNDVYLLTGNVVVEDVNFVYKKRGKDMSMVKKYSYLGWGACCLSTENMIKQWHSIESVWNLMEETSAKMPLSQYKRVGLFRSDILYITPINISDSRAALPAFSSWYGVNDRIFYGCYEHAKVWATMRFQFIEPFTKYYLIKNHSWDNILPLEESSSRSTNDIISNYLHHGGRQGFHSETFLAKMLLNYSIPFEAKPICAWRIRSGGIVQKYDC